MKLTHSGVDESSVNTDGSTRGNERIAIFILDGAKSAWQGVTLGALSSSLAGLCMAINCWQIQHQCSRIFLFLATDGGCEMVFGPASPLDKSESLFMNRLHIEDILRRMSNPIDSTIDAPTSMARTLAKSLCIVYRIRQIHSLVSHDARITVISPAGRVDHSPAYVSLMNVAFAAHRLSCPINVLLLASSQQSSILAQVGRISGGLVRYVEDCSQIQSLLLTAPSLGPASTDPTIHRHLHHSQSDAVDLRPACFCHGRTVDVGHVCTVCLAIFCSFQPICSMCRTKFALSNVK